MNGSTLASTLVTIRLIFIAVGVPVWVLLRLSGGVLPVHAADLLLVALVICWYILTKAFVQREQAIDSLATVHGSPIWYGHRMVAESLFGAGAGTALPADEPSLHQLVAPRELAPDELAPAIPASGFDLGLINPDEGDKPKAIPIIDAVESDGPIIEATEHYLVSRGDTWWSVAESTLGDGRDWTAVRDLNIGLEVAPGMPLQEGQELRIGWSILVPVKPHVDGDERAV